MYLPVSRSNPVSLCVGLPGSLCVSITCIHVQTQLDMVSPTQPRRPSGFHSSGHRQIPGGKVEKGVSLKTNVALCLPSPSCVSHPTMKPLRQKGGLGWDLKQSQTLSPPPMTPPLPVEPSRRRTHSVNLGAQTLGLRLSPLLSERVSCVYSSSKCKTRPAKCVQPRRVLQRSISP